MPFPKSSILLRIDRTCHKEDNLYYVLDRFGSEVKVQFCPPVRLSHQLRSAELSAEASRHPKDGNHCSDL